MREWLETDGLGGFAMGAADGIRARRYHAVLLAATKPPDARMVLVADLEVFAETAEGRFSLSSHRYRGGVVYPDGATRIASFRHEPWPRWEYALPGGVRIACELAMTPGAPCTHVRWTQLAGPPARLWVRPLLAGRDYHATHHENGGFRFDAETRDDVVTWRPYGGVPAIACRHPGRYEHAPEWYRAFDLEIEAMRGLDHEEDLASPGIFTFDLPGTLVFAMDRVDDHASPFGARASGLERAADAYLVRRGTGTTIIAGYPWFADWGRDTFISLRGLCLARGKRDQAAAILREWARVIDGGMLPNRFGEHDAAPEYNSVDAALWFVVAAHDAALAQELAAPIAAIVDGYARGTRHGIRQDRDGLLACGVPGLQLTWMDAKIGDQVITPRIGKPVEIQALWINALAIAGRDITQAQRAFEQRFWNGGALHDVVDVDHVAGTADPTIRPNQIFAVGGLPHAVLTGERAREVVERCFADLWTPAGPRSLSPADSRYRGRYLGGPLERDRSYHNGPIWPWLAGAFIEAWVRVHRDAAEARRRFFAPLLDRLEIAGLGHLSEIADGDPPHTPCGCPFQAWSVAELVRLDRVVLRHTGA
ncbi:MAG: glycogen debranching enzyme family protein [Deltaproteobacteria bacterium]|nr:glycogen debranching enzyme family protein [Deltaproteobacteria bacterium]